MQPLITTREGQVRFRNGLIEHYGCFCFVTNSALAVEAAHVKPYRLERDNGLDNGVLLASDWHFLFDSHDWTIVVNDIQNQRFFRVVLGNRMLIEPRYHSYNNRYLGAENRSIFSQLSNEYGLNPDNFFEHNQNFRAKNPNIPL
ncbi:hypothetical protein DICPUDRAFT_146821 [Dictyostelium purpureum]|uniref:HNH nuclease domain-containing protein n=1 Tax=Dictyostelium purpureum TaxID=5786 RepID=F0Z6Z4_DICPU|nr:uncharacterized protein DICPUDRAFT_146821 [Dictyostelium purpureum]EGC40291.1 hypothetical protein DICPUDRAFT_146821 [Dictyostelium purpureum]|eukprot:XP_003283227.1 hypothetical protein DICPUDRAFT_146821 [Dictyostelium purpureum]